MWEEVFNLAINNGIWAVLFLALLVYQLKDSKVREEKYQKTISSLSASLTTITSVKETVKTTHEKVVKMDKNLILIKKKLTPKIKTENAKQIQL